MDGPGPAEGGDPRRAAPAGPARARARAEAGGGGARDCLRLTTGPINAGDGPFIKTFTFLSDARGGRLDNAAPYVRGEARQVIVSSDGSRRERPSGNYSFHTTHAHFHDEGILTYELFRVVGDRLAPAGAGTKSGFCPADQLIGDWRASGQDPAGTFGEGDSATGSCYGAADDGTFALIRVIGRRFELLERGQGASHRDRRKVVFDGFGPASRDAYPGELPRPRRRGR